MEMLIFCEQEAGHSHTCVVSDRDEAVTSHFTIFPMFNCKNNGEKKVLLLNTDRWTASSILQSRKKKSNKQKKPELRDTLDELLSCLCRLSTNLFVSSFRMLSISQGSNKNCLQSCWILPFKVNTNQEAYPLIIKIFFHTVYEFIFKYF